MKKTKPDRGSTESRPTEEGVETIAKAERELERLRALPVVEVTSLDVLEAACREPIYAEFVFPLGDDGKPSEKSKHYKVPGRLLTPEEMDSVMLILEKALPDLIAGAPGSDGEARYDLRNPAYLAAKQKYKAEAQALALYLAYPMFRENEKVKAATTPTVRIELLTKVMQTFFTDNIRQTLWYTAIGWNKLWERVNFF